MKIQIKSLETNEIRVFEIDVEPLRAIKDYKDTLVVDQLGKYTITKYIHINELGGYEIRKEEYKGKIDNFKLFEGINEVSVLEGGNINIEYMLNSPYTQGVFYSLDKKTDKDKVIETINESPETASIKADKISLEGVTTINNGFIVDLEGNATMNNAIMNNATINGKLITKEGAYVSYFFKEEKRIYTNNYYQDQVFHGFYNVIESKNEKEGYLNTWGCIPRYIKAFLPDNLKITEIYIYLTNEPYTYYEERATDKPTNGYEPITEFIEVYSGNTKDISIYTKKYIKKAPMYSEKIYTVNYKDRIIGAWNGQDSVSFSGIGIKRSENLINNVNIQKIEGGQVIELTLAPNNYNYTYNQFYPFGATDNYWTSNLKTNILSKNGDNEIYLMVNGYLSKF